MKLLHESNATPLTRKGNLWSAVLITPGQGSSADYTESVLSESAARAFPKGTHNYIQHPSEQNPDRSPEKLWGTLAEDARFEPGVGIVGEIEVMPHWKDFVEAVAPHVGLSIFALGESDEDGNLTALVADRQNTVDMVSYPGREGSGLTTKLYESAISHSTKTPDASSAPATKKEGSMDKEVLEAIQALTATVTAFVTEQKVASEAADKAKADADAAATSVESALAAYNEKVTAIEAVADLLPSQVTALRAEALKGTDVAPLIESAKTIATEAVAAAKAKEESVEQSTGFSLGNGANVKTAAEALPKGW